MNRPEGPPPGYPPTERGRNREHEQRRRPLGEDDVLQQVRPEERVQRERLQLRREGGEDQRERGRSGRDAEPARRLCARDECVAERERRDEPDGLRREVHPATLAARARSEGVITRGFHPLVIGSNPIGRSPFDVPPR